MKNVNEKFVKSVIDELNLGGKFNIKDINKVYDIVTIGDERLRMVNEDVDDIGNIRDLVINMVNTLYLSGGCGIAAPQVGVNLNLFIIKVIGRDENDEEYVEFPLTVFINPKIIEYSEETEFDYEGCLSINNYYAEVERSLSVLIEYTDLFGSKHVQRYENFNARAIQHEYDHLQGIIFTDICDIMTLTTKENLLLNKEDKE